MLRWFALFALGVLLSTPVKAQEEAAPAAATPEAVAPAETPAPAEVAPAVAESAPVPAETPAPAPEVPPTPRVAVFMPEQVDGDWYWFDYGAGQQHLEVAGRGQKRLVERALPGEDIMQRAPGLQVQHHVEVGQTEVGIDHQHPLAPAGQRGGEIGGQHRLADAALAAGDREDTRTLGAAGRGRLGAGRGRQGRRAHRVESSVSGMNADMVLNSMSRSSLLTSEWGGSSMQVRLRPAALAR